MFKTAALSQSEAAVSYACHVSLQRGTGYLPILNVCLGGVGMELSTATSRTVDLSFQERLGVTQLWALKITILLCLCME